MKTKQIDADLKRTSWAESNDLLREYYDTEWGMPVYGENEIFERLSLEGFQSGLSWLSILKRRDAFRECFMDFDVDLVAEFDDADVERLLEDERIIRNRAKIMATITNARAIQKLRDEGGISELFWSYRPEKSPAVSDSKDLPTTSKESELLTKELKSRGFKYVGAVMIYAAMGAMGIIDLHVVDSYRRGCSGLWNIDGSRV